MHHFDSFNILFLYIWTEIVNFMGIIKSIGIFLNFSFFCFHFSQTVNERADDPDARPMLYDPLQGGRTTKTNQYLATTIGKYRFYGFDSKNFIAFRKYS